MSKTYLFYVANVAQLALRFVQMILITRLLTAEGLGIYYASAAYPQLFSRIADLGLPHAVRYHMLKSPASSKAMLKLLLKFALAITPLVLLVFFYVDELPLESDEIAASLHHNFLTLGLYCVALAINSILLAILISIEKFLTILIGYTLPFVVFISLTLREYFSDGLTSDEVLLQLLIAELVTSGIYLLGIRFSGRLGDDHSIKSGEVIRYAIQIYPTGFLKVLTTRLDKVILSFLAPAAFIGYYSVLMTIRDISIFPISTYGQMYMNKLSSAFQRGKSTITRDVNVTLAIVFAIFAMGFIVYLIVQDAVLSLFFKETTRELREAAFYLLLSSVPLALISFLSNVFLASNRPRFVSYSSVVTICIFYGIIFTAYQFIDVQAFFYASLLSTSIGFLYLLIVYRRQISMENV